MTPVDPTILTAEDCALVRRFEPILRFTQGELFFPMDVDRYLADATLYAQYLDGTSAMLVPRGQLDGNRLAAIADPPPGTVLYMQVASALSAQESRRFRQNTALAQFRAGPGRLTQVGLPTRFIDLGFSLSLLLRGAVPGGLALGSAQHYQALQQREERYSYYTRVIRAGGYIILHYWFFYAFNDWRSSFYGVNDHEGDWESVTLYLIDSPDRQEGCQLRWLVYSTHDAQGDDLRRRADDPEVTWEGEHPIVYCGAGSHANYYRAGEYLPAIEVPFTSRFAQLSDRVSGLWAKLGEGDDIGKAEKRNLRLPFVDYARGDGVSIGPGQAHPWDARFLQDSEAAHAPKWVTGYHGLWGLKTSDPIEGEDAPAGPRYQRDGTLRQAWYDPLGYCGLEKEPPPGQEKDAWEARQNRLFIEQEELATQIAQEEIKVRDLSIDLRAIMMRGGPLQEQNHLIAQQQLVEHHLNQLQAHASALAEQGARLATTTPVQDNPRAHLHHPVLPAPTPELRLTRLAAIWSAVSVGGLLLILGLLAQFTTFLLPGLLMVLGSVIFIEALFRRRVAQVVSQVGIFLAVLATLVIVVTFWHTALLLAVVVIGVGVIIDNLRELFH